MTQSAITTCNAALNARNALLNSGKVEIRTGTAADIDAAQTGSILETIILPSSVFPNASSRTSSSNTITGITAASTATAGTKHYVAYNSSNGVERNGSAGTSGTDMILSSDTWNAGDSVSITSWSTAEAK
jgi:hypothetical protein